MRACVLLVATAALLISSSVVTVAPVSAATALFLQTAGTGQRDCQANPHSAGGEIIITGKVDFSTTGVNYTLYNPSTQLPLNASMTTPTFAGDSSGTVNFTLSVDVADGNVHQQDMVVSDVNSYLPSNTQSLTFYACPNGVAPYVTTTPTLTLDAYNYRDCTPSTNAPNGLASISFSIGNTDSQESYKLYGGNDMPLVVAFGNTPGNGSRISAANSFAAPTTGAFSQVIKVSPTSVYQPSNSVTADVPACSPPPPPPPVNNPPVAVNDTATTLSNTAVTTNVTSNDTDANGNTLSVTSVTQPANGTAVVASASSTTYTPNTGFVGNDSYTYTISDGKGGTATATVAVTVNAPTPPSIPVPVARLALSPSSGAVPLIVHADGSASTVGSGFVSYTYVWGDGQIDVSNSPIASHTYPQGRFTMALVVVNEAGHSISRQIVYSLPRTPRVFANETLTQGRAAIAAIHVAVGNTLYPAGHGATPPAGYKYVVSAFALQKRTSTGYSYTSLAAGQLIPYGSVVAVRLKLVLK